MILNPLKKKKHDEVLLAIEKALPAIRAFARGLSTDEAIADDLVQSTCERALNRLDQVHDTSGVKSWLNRIVYTQWQDSLRRQNRRNNHLKLLNDQSGTNFSSSGRFGLEDAFIANIDMQKALNTLSEEQRAAVVLVSMLGHSYQEAAEILSVAPGTVASRVARARGVLADVLTGRSTKEKKYSVSEVSVNE